ncbi:sensor histidine kinase [Polaribacter sp. IC073]|uniref:tetratricopeptide repeat-containing sensor histidine kinase n=1 Tax=Polaribacter sp. IC073 TaxID=2508540 RepID=UPI00167C12D5|nr:sensor histidine kinase [Polaribacter sp. IC073]
MKILYPTILALFFYFATFSQKNTANSQELFDSATNEALKAGSLEGLIYNVRDLKKLDNFTNRRKQHLALTNASVKSNNSRAFTGKRFHDTSNDLNYRRSIFPQSKIVQTDKYIATNPFLIGGIHLKKGNANSNSKEYSKYIKEYTATISRYKKNQKDSIEIADAIYSRANVYFNDNQYLASFKDYQLAAKYYEKLGDKVYMNYSLAGIINIYGINGFNEKTIEERRKLIKRKIETNLLEGLYIDYYNQSLNYKKLDSFKKQEEYLLKANSYIENNKGKNITDSDFLVIKSGLVLFYATEKKIDEAKKYLKEATIYYNKTDKNSFFTDDFYKAKATYLFASSNYKEALIFAKKSYALFKDNNNMPGVIESSRLLSMIYTKMGNNNLALDYFKKYYTVKDSIFSIAKTSALIYYRALYKSEDKEKEISEQKVEIKELAKKYEAKKSFILMGVISFVFIFLILLLYINRIQFKKERKMQEEYAQKLLLSEEEERKRISKDLHDSLGQSLLLIKHKIAAKNDDEAKELVNSAIEEVRSISRVLHPFQLEHVGLSKALQNLVFLLDESYKDTYIFGEIDHLASKLCPQTEINVFRIVQECLSNVMKHAKAASAKVTLINTKESIVITVEDNGIGFNFTEKYNDQESLGLKIIKERVKFIKGTLKINSIKNSGTTITVKFPKE